MAYGIPPGQAPGRYQAMPSQVPNREPERRVHPAALLGVSLWRLLIVVFAIYGFSVATGWSENLEGLSQQASLLTGVIYAGLLCYPLFTMGRRHEPRSPWLRGAATVLLLLVSVTFLTLLEGDLDDQPFEHLYTPLVVLLDWLFVGRNQANVKWWHPLTWVAFPLAYLGYYLSAEVSLYDFLDPSNGAFGGLVMGFLLAVVAAGYVLYGTGKIKGSTAGRGRPSDLVTVRDRLNYAANPTGHPGAPAPHHGPPGQAPNPAPFPPRQSP